MSAGEIDIDNTFSPKHFYRYIKDTKVCAEYYGEWWYTLDLKTPITSVEACFHVCLENAKCSYFAFDNSTQTCKLLYTCTPIQDIPPGNVLFFHINARPYSFPSNVAYFGTYYKFYSVNSELRWIFPASLVKRSSSIKLRLRYKVEVPTSDLFIQFYVKITYSSNRIIHAPVSEHWVISESIETALKKV